MTTTEITSKFANMTTTEIDAWLAGDDGAEIITSLLNLPDNETAAHLLRCILQSDAQALSIISRS